MILNFSLYCNACETLITSKSLKAEILLNGNSISCGSGLKPGVYENLELVFCLPDYESILESQGLSKETFKTIIQNEVQKNFFKKKKRIF